MYAFRQLVRRSVVVNLVDETAIQGVLFKQAGPLLILKNAVHLRQGFDPLAIDGDAVVEREKVLFIQAL